MPLIPETTEYQNNLLVKKYSLTDKQIIKKKNRLFTKNIIIYNLNPTPIKSNTTQSEVFTRAIKYGSIKDFCPHYFIDDICAWQVLDIEESYLFKKLRNNSNLAIAIIGTSERTLSNAKKIFEYLLNKYNLDESAIIFAKEKKSFVVPQKQKIYEVKEPIKEKQLNNLNSKDTIEIAAHIFDGKWSEEKIGINNLILNSTKNLFPISALAIKTSKGILKYRVHLIGGGWLKWITGYDLLKLHSGYAGIKNSNIDAIQMQLTGIENFKVIYRIGYKNKFSDWIKEEYKWAETKNQIISSVEIKIVPKEGNI